MPSIHRPLFLLAPILALILMAPPSAHADCAASPDSLNFGSVLEGHPETLRFTLTNTAGVRVVDELRIQGDYAFTYLFDNGSTILGYDLDAGEQMEVRVTASPIFSGLLDLSIDLGAAANGCATGSVPLYSYHQPAPQSGEPECSMTPYGSMDFPPTVVGETSEDRLWIINSGGEYPQQNAGILEGSVPAEAGPFRIPWGGDFQITYHQIWDVVFAPAEPGVYEVPLSLPDLCSPLTLKGIGLAEGVLAEQSATELDLGLVQMGSAAVTSFSVRNLGDEPLPLTLPTACGPFEIVGGGFTRILAPGEAEMFFVRFEPVDTGPVTCDLDLQQPAVTPVTLRGTGLENQGLADVLGIWFDQSGQVNLYQTTQPNELVTAYLMIQNPSALWGASGWEARVEMSGNGMALTWDLAGVAFNALTPPSFAVGLGGDPVAGGSPLLLATLSFVQPDPETPTYFHIHPVAAPSLPGVPLYADGADPGRLIPLTPASGDEAMPVAAVNEASTDTPAARAHTRLDNPEPNPFNPSTSLRFELAKAGRARLELYDLQGRRVRTLVDERLDSGPHVRVWDGRNDAGRPAVSGVYLARLIAGDQVRRVRLTLLK